MVMTAFPPFLFVSLLFLLRFLAVFYETVIPHPKTRVIHPSVSRHSDERHRLRIQNPCISPSANAVRTRLLCHGGGRRIDRGMYFTCACILGFSSFGVPHSVVSVMISVIWHFPFGS
ncbi:hypothetical protein BJX96DRAFT_85656 [Aspergillus floccosus]